MQRRIIFNGQEFASESEMPAEIRELYRRVLTELGQDGGDPAGASEHPSKANIVIDGREYGSIDEMPPDHRQLYEEATRYAAGPGHYFSTPDAVEGGGKVHIQSKREVRMQGLTAGDRWLAGVESQPGGGKKVRRYLLLAFVLIDIIVVVLFLLRFVVLQR